MTVSFTSGATAVQPLVINGWESARTSQSFLHQIVGGGIDAVLRPATPRSGTLAAVFTDKAAAFALEMLLAAGVIVTFADTDVPDLNMAFVASDDIRVTRADEAVTIDGADTYIWLVEFSYQELV